MNALVVGFDVEETRRLSHELRLAGHHVLGAVGKQGAWTFLRAIQPDVVVIPRGPDGERARGWVTEVGVDVAFIDVPPGVDAAPRLARFARGEPLDEPTPEPAPTPTLSPTPEPAPTLTLSPTPALTLEPPSSAPDPEPPSRSARRPRLPESPEDDAQGREPHPDLSSKLAQVRFGDYHSILEVEPGGSPYAVREQRDRLARRYSPRGWPGRLTPEDIDILNEISRGIADAFLILSDPELAMRYERALAGARPTEALPR